MDRRRFLAASGAAVASLAAACAGAGDGARDGGVRGESATRSADGGDSGVAHNRLGAIGVQLFSIPRLLE